MDPDEFAAMMARAREAGKRAQAEREAAWQKARDEKRAEAKRLFDAIGLTDQQRTQLADWLWYRAMELDGQSETGTWDAEHWVRTGEDSD